MAARSGTARHSTAARKVIEAVLDWHEFAACRGRSLSLFFGYEGERVGDRKVREELAREVCASCPVRGECLEFALESPEKYGFWAGLNEDERAAVRRRQMRKAASAGVGAS